MEKMTRVDQKGLAAILKRINFLVQTKGVSLLEGC